ncbi:glycoside hydrolase family 6 protein [Streptomyces sp. DT171]|uniref:glycoside hydrolase family 6 protein n=1 Tax=Streptomyces sp. DT171 TaxID=3416524 RepID=UPI003CF69B9B
MGPDNSEKETKGLTEAAEKTDREALLVLYDVPRHDCGQFSKGGAADGDAYRAWLEKVATGSGDRRATVLLEPDAVLHPVDGCTPQEFHEERHDLLRGPSDGSRNGTGAFLVAGRPLGVGRSRARARPPHEE